jgi:hypothetical protein
MKSGVAMCFLHLKKPYVVYDWNYILCNVLQI